MYIIKSRGPSIVPHAVQHIQNIKLSLTEALVIYGGGTILYGSFLIRCDMSLIKYGGQVVMNKA